MREATNRAPARLTLPQADHPQYGSWYLALDIPAGLDGARQHVLQARASH
ncbi:hypothetical protein AB0F17_14530 [Nonomuraea sp. NPDC026600]